MKLNEAMQVFLGDYSENTARTYGVGLDRFLAWSRERGIVITSVGDLDAKWVIPFARSLKSGGLSARSIAVYVSAIVQFLHWLKREKVSNVPAESLLVLHDQVKDWNRKNTVHSLPRLPKEAAVVAILKSVHETEDDTERLRLYHLRNAALVEMLASTGCRISEAANLKREDLIPDLMVAQICAGKGRKDRIIFFRSEDSWNAVMEYLGQRDRLGFTVIGQEPVFARHDKVAHGRGEILPLTTTSMRAAWHKLREEAGAAHVTPHQLRHRAGTRLHKDTGDLKVVQEYLGHARISTTADTYTHLDVTDIIKAVRGG